MGYLYKQPGSSKWWCKYYANGRPIRESTGQTKWEDAKRKLKEREGRVANGEPIVRHADRVRVEELLEELWRYYVTTGERNLVEVGGRLTPLRAFFTGRRVSTLAGGEFDRYAELRQQAGLSNATINREFSVLRRALRLGMERNKVRTIPKMPRLKERAPRQGFFERDQFQAVRRLLPEDLQVAVTIMHTFGWRSRSEVLRLPLAAVDLAANTLRLEPGATKNNDARVVYLTPELRTMLEAQIEAIMALSWRLQRTVPHLFPHLTGSRAGTVRYEFRKKWATACRKAGIPGMLRHDFRRTAVRNMVNAGIPERVAMMMTGHKTRNVFDRYHIVNGADLQEASRKLAGIVTGIVAPAPPLGSAQLIDKPTRARSSVG